jgi:hypothetical protein
VDQPSKAALLKPAGVISYNLWIGHEPPPLSIPSLRSDYSVPLVGFLNVKLGKYLISRLFLHILFLHISCQLLLIICNSGRNFSVSPPPFELDFHLMLIERQPLVKVQLSSNIVRLYFSGKEHKLYKYI